MSDFCIVLWTVKDLQEAEKIISSLLEEKLIACATMLNACQSMFVWKGKVEKQEEVQVIIKTRSSSFKKIQEHILHNASYDVPEILQINIEEGLKPYLNWIKEVT